MTTAMIKIFLDLLQENFQGKKGAVDQNMPSLTRTKMET